MDGPSLADTFFESVYAELRHVARRTLRTERRDHTLQTTALVHEAYLRLAGDDAPTWETREHFLSTAARVMRHILVDHARRRGAAKRYRGVTRLSLDEVVDLVEERDIRLVALGAALDELKTIDPDLSRIIDLRFFAGLTIPEIASVIGVAEATVSRRWKVAKLWLQRTLETTSL